MRNCKDCRFWERDTRSKRSWELKPGEEHGTVKLPSGKCCRQDHPGALIKGDEGECCGRTYDLYPITDRLFGCVQWQGRPRKKK